MEDKLVYEMGFNKTEAKMALAETNGNFENAVQLLLSGKFAPPPYSPTGSMEQPTAEPPQHSGFMDKLFGSHKKAPVVTHNPATAPPVMELPGKSTGGESSFKTAGDVPNFTDNIPCLPPPYEKFEKVQKIKEWEECSNVFHFNNEIKTEIPDLDIAKYSDKRCPVCFNEILSTRENGQKYMNEEIVQYKLNHFHYFCFTKKHGPKCTYCCFPLAQPDKDHELSGQYLKYNGRDYHVECYTKFAGPRCAYCCNVIVEVAGGEYSGGQVVDANKQFHIECYQKKMYAAWRAKNS